MSFKIISTSDQFDIQQTDDKHVDSYSSGDTYVWVSIPEFIEDEVLEEIVSVKLINLETKIFDKNGELKNISYNLDEILDEEQHTKKIILTNILKDVFYEVVWEETGTDTISISQYPFEQTKKYIKVTNYTGKTLSFGISNLGIFGVEIEEGESKIYPITVYGNLEKFQTYVDYINDYQTPSESIVLNINNIVKNRPFIPFEIEWKKDEKANKIFCFDDYTISSDGSNMKCFDIDSFELLWEYPNESTPGNSLSISLEAYSVENNKVIISNYKDNSRIISCLSSDSGIPVWTLNDVIFVTTFGNTDKVLFCDYEYDRGYKENGYYRCVDINSGMELWTYQFEYHPCLESFIGADNKYVYFKYCEMGYMPSLSADNSSKKKDETYPFFLLGKCFPKSNTTKDYISKWKKSKIVEFNKLEDEYLNNFEWDQYYPEIFYTNQLIIRKINWDSGVGFSGLSFIQVFNAKTGDLICNTNQIDSFEIQEEILEVGGYFFKIPSGEHIDLPTSYRLQHYSKATGKYYFLDTEKGEIVCVTLPE